jgi:hypothetical protein
VGRCGQMLRAGRKIFLSPVNGKVLPTQKDSPLVGECFIATAASGTLIGSPTSPVPYGRVAIIRISLGCVGGQFRMRMSRFLPLAGDRLSSEIFARKCSHAEISTFHCRGGGLFRGIDENVSFLAHLRAGLMPASRLLTVAKLPRVHVRNSEIRSVLLSIRTGLLW